MGKVLQGFALVYVTSCGTGKVPDSGAHSTSPSATVQVSGTATSTPSAAVASATSAVLGATVAPRPSSTVPPKPLDLPPLADPCGLSTCEKGKGCCHNPQATTKGVPEDFIALCLPPGEPNAPLDSACADYECATSSFKCKFLGCRLSTGQCGVVVNRFTVVGGEESISISPNLGCLDERWLQLRNESGIPPDPTLQCAVDYWWSDAGAETSVAVDAANTADSDAGDASLAPSDASSAR
jgi:hypothetical protein